VNRKSALAGTNWYPQCGVSLNVQTIHYPSEQAEMVEIHQATHLMPSNNITSGDGSNKHQTKIKGYYMDFQVTNP
jgi:hypothetical protein